MDFKKIDEDLKEAEATVVKAFGMTLGIIIAIVVGAIVLLVLAIVACCYCCCSDGERQPVVVRAGVA